MPMKIITPILLAIAIIALIVVEQTKPVGLVDDTTPESTLLELSTDAQTTSATPQKKRVWLKTPGTASGTVGSIKPAG